MASRYTHSTANLIALLQEKVRLNPLHRRLFYLVFGVVWGSGFVWLVAEWLRDPSLGPARTPLQILCMKTHGAAMLVFLAMLGTLLSHVRRGFAVKTNRLSGAYTIGVNGALALTGWLVYYVTEDAARQWSSVIHWSVGLSILPLLYAHTQLGRRWANRLTEKSDSISSETAAMVARKNS